MTGLAPRSRSFSTVYWATLPLPETRQVLPSSDLAAGREHLGREVDAAVAGRLRADQRAAPVQALAGEHAGELVAQLLVHAEQEADLAPADADVTGRDVGVGADVALELRHEGLAETHHLVVALALGVEVRAALAAAHGQRGQRVLEHLLEGEELEDPQVDRGVEAQAALVGTDGAVHLDPEAAVDLDAALVVEPRHAEQDHPLRLDDALEHPMMPVLGVTVQAPARGTRRPPRPPGGTRVRQDSWP